jgi:hypothetical protein
VALRYILANTAGDAPKNVDERAYVQTKSKTEMDSSGKRLLDLCGGRLASHAWHGLLPC